MIEFDVVGADVRQAHGEDVGLALDLHEVLREDVLQRAGVDGVDLAGLHGGHAVGRLASRGRSCGPAWAACARGRPAWR